MSPIVIAITLFIFALILGIAVIGRVPATLHTPLMSGANSIHGVVLVGVILVAAHAESVFGYIVIFFAALLGTLNVVGGYVVTDRMLDMFKPKKEKLEPHDAANQVQFDGSISLDVVETIVEEKPAAINEYAVDSAPENASEVAVSVADEEEAK
jgi:NAD(P) transhydrogenase subunit alpha